MEETKVHDVASDVDTADGVVLVSGPDGVAVSLTPEAAMRTGVRLIEGAAAAKGDKAISDDKAKRAKERLHTSDRHNLPR